MQGCKFCAFLLVIGGFTSLQVILHIKGARVPVADGLTLQSAFTYLCKKVTANKDIFSWYNNVLNISGI